MHTHPYTRTHLSLSLTHTHTSTHTHTTRARAHAHCYTSTHKIHIKKTRARAHVHIYTLAHAHIHKHTTHTHAGARTLSLSLTHTHTHTHTILKMLAAFSSCLKMLCCSNSSFSTGRSRSKERASRAPVATAVPPTISVTVNTSHAVWSCLQISGKKHTRICTLQPSARPPYLGMFVICSFDFSFCRPCLCFRV